MIDDIIQDMIDDAMPGIDETIDDCCAGDYSSACRWLFVGFILWLFG